jgi:hypothetical protein
MSKGSPGQGASSAPPKRRGRPNLPAGEGKRYALGLRTTKELRDLLQQAADLSGRSLAQEIEFRLERSFERERTLAELLTASLGGERTSRHVQALAGIACNLSVLSEQGSADAWLNDHKLFTLVRERWNNYLDTFQPSTPNTRRGKKVAIELLNMIEKAKETDPRGAAFMAYLLASEPIMTPAARKILVEAAQNLGGDKLSPNDPLFKKSEQ